MIGKVFNADGRVGGFLASDGDTLPDGLPEEIAFRVLGTRDETDKYPAWTDVLVDGRIKLRINPEVAAPPYFRLYDAVALVGRSYREIPLSPMAAEAVFGGQRFLIWRERLLDGEVAVMDTAERIDKWQSPAQTNVVRDGMWRIGVNRSK